MKFAYIIGPYGQNALFKRSEQQNTKVAEYLAQKAFAQGYTPIVPHSMIHAGIFGDDSNPAERSKGERATLAIMSSFMKQKNVELWVIADYYYSAWFYSPGTKKELSLWCKKRGTKDVKHFLYVSLQDEMEKKYGKNMAHK